MSVLSGTPESSGRPDYVALYLVAEGQRGYFTTRQAHQVGISDRLLTHWAKTGRFQRIACRLSRRGGTPG